MGEYKQVPIRNSVASAAKKNGIDRGILGTMMNQKKPLRMLLSLVACALLVGCDDSTPAAEATNDPAAHAAATEPIAKAPENKPPQNKPQDTPQDTPAVVAPPAAPSKPVAITPAPPKSTKKKPAVAMAPEPAPAAVSEPVVAPAPASDVPPELQKLATMAAAPKFREFTALAAERHTLQLQASQLRLEMRGVVPTDAQQAAVASVQQAIGKVGDRMDSYVSSKTWTQDELMTMDFIVGEQMRLRPPPG